MSSPFLRSSVVKLLSVVKRFASLINRHPKKTLTLALLLILWLFCLPTNLFNKPLSAVLEDRNGDLLCAHIAADGQWRFPPPDSLPIKYQTCVIAFEDKRFKWHPGVDPIGIGRSMIQNIQGGGIVSGGSTITMQVIRLMRDNPPRTVWQKLIEVCMATRLELTYSKKSILKLYAANAPYGGNVVGIEAASWRYYGKSPHQLSWSEAATLAVLPNSPALIHPGRNRTALLQKRNRLLDKLLANGTINANMCELSKEEPLPEAPLPLPQYAPHLLDRLMKAEGSGNNLRFKSTLEKALQINISELAARRQKLNSGNEVHNLAAVVMDVVSGEVLAYVGNVVGAGKEHGASVDILAAPRSTGSILKPYLYALALESGDILPNSLLRDVPTQLGDYKPENYYENYDGAVPAKRALIRSLNIPFVLLLQQYGLEKFHFNLQRLGLTTLHKSPDHYGLSLILGGAEAKLLDITNIYACMARRLGQYYDRNGQYSTDDFGPPQFIYQGTKSNKSKQNWSKSAEKLSAGAIWHTFEAMQEVERPSNSGDWELFRTSRPIAWKTGTSYGFRDAWAAGVTPRYAVGVWVGNADGEGRPGLMGVTAAAPVLFEIMEQLPSADRWFDPPYDDMAQIPVCRQSGWRAGEHCQADTVWIPKTGLKAAVCPNHQLIHLDPTSQWQVNSDCASPAEMIHQPWFILPPIEEYYYKSKNPSYLPPPPYRPDCLAQQTVAQGSPMQWIYPKDIARIYVPIDLSGQLSSTIFQVAHRNPDTEIYWHLDETFLGTTKTFHQKALQPPVGKHKLTLVDQQGYRLESVFEIVGKK